MMHDPLRKNLAEIAGWIREAPPPEAFRDENEAMGFFMGAMKRTLYLLRVAAGLAPNEEVSTRGYVKRHAIIVGHMVRMAKLYDAFYMHVAKRELEIAGIFMRLICETDIRILYFLNAKSKAFRSYVLTSYRSERQMLIDLEKKSKERALIPIEKRILRAIKRDLKQDGISLNELRNNRNWKIDRRDVRGMLKALGREQEYSYTFGSTSRWVHGGWLELKYYHLQKNGRFYQPRLDYGDPDLRIVCPITFICLDTLIQFLRWSKGDPDGIVEEIARMMFDIVFRLDAHHEAGLAARDNPVS